MTKKSSYKPILRVPGEVRPWSVSSHNHRPNGSSAVLAPSNSIGTKTHSSGLAVPLGRGAAHSTISETEQLLLEARGEAESIRLTAYERGLEEGREFARSEVEAERCELSELTAQIRDAYARFCQSQAPELARVAIGAAEQLVREQIEIDPTKVTKILNHALEQITASTQITVHLHPDDVEIVRQSMADNEMRRVTGVTLCAEPSVERGGCWIESEQGEVDATIPGRVFRLTAALSEL
jgi:flagellar assembly protein FliH